jgi:hypothetical protein
VKLTAEDDKTVPPCVYSIEKYQAGVSLKTCRAPLCKTGSPAGSVVWDSVVSTAPASVLGAGSVRFAVNPPDAGRTSVPPLAGRVAVHGFPEHDIGSALPINAAFPVVQPAIAALTNSAIQIDPRRTGRSSTSSAALRNSAIGSSLRFTGPPAGAAKFRKTAPPGYLTGGWQGMHNPYRSRPAFK